MASSKGTSPNRNPNHSYIFLDASTPDASHHRVDGTSSDDEEEVNDIGSVHSHKLGVPSDNMTSTNPFRFSDLTMKISSALFYGICSFLITVINKIVLTSYDFPSTNILGLGQIISILIILKLSSWMHLVTIRQSTMRHKKIWILAFIYLCNLISGLGGTKHLPLPMFIALRRVNIALTAIGEFYILHVKQKLSIVLTIVAMIGGSFVAAAFDLAFNALGYSLAMCSNIFTASYSVYAKKTIDSHEVNKNEILFYNAFFSIVPLSIICCLTNNTENLGKYAYWSDIGFMLSFLTSCIMGYLLMFSTICCTQYNSALTTTIVGTLKNILTTYVGMFIGGDYKFSAANFIGLNISLAGSLAYSYLTFARKSDSKNQSKS